MQLLNPMKNILLFLVITILVSCTKTHELKLLHPPKEAALIQGIEILVVENSKKGDPLYDMMEQALREHLSQRGIFTLIPSVETKKLISDLALFNYIPKLYTDTASRLGVVSYELKEATHIKRIQGQRYVMMQSCNYLNKKQPCRSSGQAMLRNGKQNLHYKLTANIVIKRQDGTPLLSRSIFGEVNLNEKFVPDKLVYRSKTAQFIARNFSKNILPYETQVKIELTGGGDGDALDMISYGAYRQAIKRIANLPVDDRNEPENLFYLGFAFEALHDYSGALEYYRQALQVAPQEEYLKKSVQRVQNAWGTKNL